VVDVEDDLQAVVERHALNRQSQLLEGRLRRIGSFGRRRGSRLGGRWIAGLCRCREDRGGGDGARDRKATNQKRRLEGHDFSLLNRGRLNTRERAFLPTL